MFVVGPKTLWKLLWKQHSQSVRRKRRKIPIKQRRVAIAGFEKIGRFSGPRNKVFGRLSGQWTIVFGRFSGPWGKSGGFRAGFREGMRKKSGGGSRRFCGTLFGMVLVELFGQGVLPPATPQDYVLVEAHLRAQDCGADARRNLTSPRVGRSRFALDRRSSEGSFWGWVAVLAELPLDPPLIRGGPLVISKDPTKPIGVRFG